MDLFGKKKDKFTVNLHKKPSECTPQEGAVYLMMVGVLADAEKLGIDPTTIHLSLEFKETNHQMCMNLERGGPGGMAFTRCNN